MYQAIFFDMGHTLSRQQPDREEVMVQLLAGQGYTISLHQAILGLHQVDLAYYAWTDRVPVAERTPEVRQEARRGFARIFLETIGISDGQTQDHPLIAILPTLFETIVRRRHVTVYPDVFPTLATLRQRGIRLGIISNWDLTLDEHVDSLGLRPYLDTVVGSQAVGSEKPERRIFDIALERLGVTAAAAMHVGDAYQADVVGARRAGITPVLLDRHNLMPQADCARVCSLDELPGLLVD